MVQAAIRRYHLKINAIPCICSVHFPHLCFHPVACMTWRYHDFFILCASYGFEMFLSFSDQDSGTISRYRRFYVAKGRQIYSGICKTLE